MRSFAACCCIMLLASCNGQPNPSPKVEEPSGPGRFAHSTIHRALTPQEKAATQLYLAEKPLVEHRQDCPYVSIRIYMAAEDLSKQRLRLSEKESPQGIARWILNSDQNAQLEWAEIVFDEVLEWKPVTGTYEVVFPGGGRERGRFEADWRRARDRGLEMDGDTQENFDRNIKPLVAGIGKGKTLVLYEGLPHQNLAKELVEKERKAKKTVKLDGFFFYDEPIRIKEDDVRQLLAICAEPRSFRLLTGAKLCGGYHPDWCIECKEGESVYRVQICFGCDEARLYGPRNELHTDLDQGVVKKLIELLSRYHKNRP